MIALNHFGCKTSYHNIANVCQTSTLDDRHGQLTSYRFHAQILNLFLGQTEGARSDKPLLADVPEVEFANCTLGKLQGTQGILYVATASLFTYKFLDQFSVTM